MAHASIYQPCSRRGCGKLSLPFRRYCREHMHCQTTGCRVKKAPYRSGRGSWHCAKHIRAHIAAGRRHVRRAYS